MAELGINILNRLVEPSIKGGHFLTKSQRHLVKPSVKLAGKKIICINENVMKQGLQSNNEIKCLDPNFGQRSSGQKNEIFLKHFYPYSS